MKQVSDVVIEAFLTSTERFLDASYSKNISVLFAFKINNIHVQITWAEQPTGINNFPNWLE